MILDTIIGIASILAFYRGWKKGIVAAILSLVGVVLALVISMKLGYVVTDYIASQNIINSKYVMLISYILLFVAVVFVFKLIIGFIEKILKMALLGWANRLAGAILYVFSSMLFVSSLFWLGSKMGIVQTEAKSESKTYSLIEPIAPITIETASKYMPYCEDILQNVKGYLQKQKV